MKAYEPPMWGRAPNSTNIEKDYLPLSFEVIKEGIVVEHLPLEAHPALSQSKSKSFLLLGRQADAVDIVLENPSVSRQHAALQFGSPVESTLTTPVSIQIMDLGSAQGTTVNKIALKPHEFAPLKVGDQVRFAASSRVYVLQGPDEMRPPEYDSVNLAALRERLEEKRAARTHRAAQAQSEGVSWGMRDDPDSDDENGSEGGDGNSPDIEVNTQAALERVRRLTESHASGDEDGDKLRGPSKALLEKLRALELKVRNMQEENRRIQAKEHSSLQPDGLTQGQQATLERNETHIEKLTAEIAELLYEHTLQAARRGDASGVAVGKRNGGRGRSNEDDDSELYDTTQATADADTNWRMKKRSRGHGSLNESGHTANVISSGSVSGSALEYEDLRRACESLERELSRLTERAVTTEAAADLCAASAEEAAHKGDEVEAELARAQEAETRAELRRVGSERRKAEEKLRAASRLLRAATPALRSLAPAGKDSDLAEVKNNAEPPAGKDSAVALTCKKSIFAPGKDGVVVGKESADTWVGLKLASDVAAEALSTPRSQTNETSGGRHSVQGKVFECVGEVAHDTARDTVEPMQAQIRLSNCPASIESDHVDSIVTIKSHRPADPALPHSATVNATASMTAVSSVGPFMAAAPTTLESSWATPLIGPCRPTVEVSVQGAHPMSLPGDASLGALPKSLLGGAFLGERDMWVPPTGQSGSGRTKLNEKLGY